MTTTLKPGDWTPTGWGAQHRIREVTDTHVVMVCHGPEEEQRAELDRFTSDADEPVRCTRCARTPGLGPMPAPVVGEVRRHPGTGTVVVCGETWDGRQPTAQDPVWRLVVNAPTGSLYNLDSYTVIGWDVIATIPINGEGGR